ncbi:MAG: ATP-binding cassette domain-containing protein [Candidatus Aminicenantia bacterium]
MNVNKAIECIELTKKFGSFTAVEGVSFSVSRGEVFGFLGPNGAGKTTTIKMICGILKPSSGEIYVEGENVWNNPQKIREKIGYMSQKFSLYNDLTVEENINFWGGIYGIQRKELKIRKEWIIEMAELKGMEKYLTSELSVAFKQRLAFGCALIHSPNIVFLDEPTSGIDPVSRKNFWEMICNLSDSGITFFITTHFIDEAENCKRVAFINNGRIVRLGPPNELKENLEMEIFEIESPQIFNALKILETRGFSNFSISGKKLRIIVRRRDEIETAISILKGEGLQVFSSEKVLPTLEEVFFLATKEREI